MDKCNIALYGCGTVGMGLARILVDRTALIDRLGDRISLKYVVDVRLDEVRRELDPPTDVILTGDLDEPLADPEVRIVVELIGGTTVANDLTRRALAAGKDVVTANKALLAEHGGSLFALARQQGRCIAFEAAVAGGIPVIAAVRTGLCGDHIQRVYGILNGTCNYILTRMLERRVAFDEALAEAQRLGYAEADPALDVDGLDSAHKLAVLARLAFGVDVRLDNIACEGIRGVDLADLEAARSLGYALKLLAVGKRSADAVELRVHPALIRATHPLADVNDVFNAVCIHGDRVGRLVMTGRGAGRNPTASAVAADIARVALGTYPAEFAGITRFGSLPPVRPVPRDEMEMSYYLALSCRGRSGVLARIAEILAREHIGIALMRRQETAGTSGDFVPVVVMTQRAPQGAMRLSLEALNRLDGLRAEETRMLRIEDI